MERMRFTLRGALVATVAGLGIAGIVLGLYVGHSYRMLAHESHAEALSRVIGLEARDVLLNMAKMQKELGYRIQKEETFRQGLRARDTAVLSGWFDQEFNRYFVTAGLLDLRKMILYDSDFRLLASSERQQSFKLDRGKVCPQQWQQIRARTGAARLKPSIARCLHDGELVSSVVVSVGGLSVSGYLQVLADPVHNLKALTVALGMPLRISDQSGELLLVPKEWPVADSASQLPIQYPLLDSSGEPALLLEMVADLTDFDRRLDERLNQLMAMALLLLAVAVLMVLLLLGRGLRPLRQLQRAVHEVGEGRYEPIEESGPHGEVNAVVGAFNQMVRKLAGERANREAAEAELREAKLAAESQAEAMFLEKEFSQVTLESIVDGVITTDTNSLITYMNPMAQRLTGWGEAEALTRPLSQVFQVRAEEGGDPLQALVSACLFGEDGSRCAVSAVLSGNELAPLPIDIAASAMTDRDQKVIGMVLIFNDVSEARELNRQLSFAASHDALTGLINRYEFERRVAALLNDAAPVEEAQDNLHHLGFIDLDQFKVVNDTCGHVAGDALLKQITGLLGDVIRQSDTLARLGGDEFALLLPGCNLEHAMRITRQACDAVRDFRFVWQEHTFTVGCSIGLVGFGEPGVGLATVLSAADTACYAAKEAGGNRVQLHRSDDQDLQLRHGEMHWVSRITHALEHDGFCLYAQPIIGLDDGAVLDLEVLVRFIDAAGNIVNPGAFLPAAERYHMSTRIDRWVIGSVLDFLASKDGGDGSLRLAINLSGSSLADREFLHFIENALAEAEVDPAALVFEITETAAIANLLEARHLISELKKLGCRFALDDFGSGLSSFAYLKNLPVDILKIDGVFVRNIVDDPMDEAMVKSINEIGHVMGMVTVAEFVESDATIEKLRAIGVDFAQGYAIAEPAPLQQQLRRFQD